MNTPLRPETLISELAARMRDAHLDWEHSTAWTKTLKDSLRQILEQEGTNVIEALYSSRELERSEFLLDLVIWDRRGGEGLSLAVESEWSQNVEEVATDF